MQPNNNTQLQSNFQSPQQTPSSPFQQLDSPYMPSPNMTNMLPQKKHPLWILLTGIGVSAILVTIGCIVFFNSHSQNEQGETVTSLQSKADALDEPINDATSKLFEISYTEGYSDNYYEASDAAATLIEQQAQLEENIESLKQQEDNLNIFTTNAAIFFFMALIILIASVILYFVL